MDYIRVRDWSCLSRLRISRDSGVRSCHIIQSSCSMRRMCRPPRDGAEPGQVFGANSFFCSRETRHSIHTPWIVSLGQTKPFKGHMHAELINRGRRVLLPTHEDFVCDVCAPRLEIPGRNHEEHERGATEQQSRKHA